jgi:cold shock CspA family protein
METKTGTVVSLKMDQKYGFIRSDGRDVFFHVSGLCEGLTFDEQLRERRVRFRVITTDTGRQKAIGVEAAD